MKTATVYRGIGFWDLLVIVLIVLKLTGTIAWSWWWILAPIWVPVVLVILFFVVLYFLGKSSWY